MRLPATIALALGTGATVMLLRRGRSFQRQFEHDVAVALARDGVSDTITDAHVASLPPAVQRYLRVAGVVGQPCVRNFHARFHGEIRKGPDAAWMPFSVDQYNFFDAPARYFLMRASRAGIPFEALHIYAGPTATMQVKLASLVTIVDAFGPQMDEAETVTLFNDMCLFAPGSLVGAPVVWQEIDAKTVGATFTNAGHTVHAVLTFNDAGELVDFVSDDRSASADGKTFTRMRWSTPMRDYRAFGPFRLASQGEARWHQPSGSYAYIRLELESIEYNVTR